MNTTKLTALAFLVSCLSGCATYKAGKIPTVDYSSIQTEKPTIFIKSSYIKLHNGKLVDLDEEKKKDISERESEFLKQIEKTGLYLVTKTDNNPDITMDLVIEEAGTVPTTCILTFFSLWISPCSVPVEYRVKATILNNKTNVRSNIAVNDGFTTYHSMFLMPFALFNQVQPVGKEVRTNLSNTIAIKAYESFTMDSKCSYTSECKTGFICETSSKECKKIADDGKFCGSVVGGGKECQIKNFVKENEPVFIEPKAPASTTSVNNDISKLESTCLRIGFKQGTEQFGDCVLELKMRATKTK